MDTDEINEYLSSKMSARRIKFSINQIVALINNTPDPHDGDVYGYGIRLLDTIVDIYNKGYQDGEHSQ